MRIIVFMKSKSIDGWKEIMSCYTMIVPVVSINNMPLVRNTLPYLYTKSETRTFTL